MDKGKTIDELSVGESAEFTKTVSEADVYGFAGISGDFNPQHVNAEYARTGPFKARVAHGVLTLSFLSSVIGNQLPGLGTIALGLETRFLKPVFYGDTITARARVAAIAADRNRVTMDLVAVNQDGDTVVDGTATVMPPR